MRRAIHVALWSLGGLLALALLPGGALIALGNTAWGRSLLERETARFTSGRVRLAGVSGVFPADMHIAELQLGDSRGVWMTAERVSLRWSPLALLAWDLHVKRLDVGRVAVARRPLSTASSTRAGGRIHLPALDIDRIVIHTLDLEPAAAGMNALLTVQGSLHYRSMQQAQVSLLARRTNGTGEYALALHLRPSRMTGRLALEEPAGGPIEHLVNLTGLGAVSVIASLAGPRNAEQLQLRARIGELRANARGTVDLEHRAAELTYSVASPAMTPRAGLSWRRIALRGRWHGPVSRPHATGVLVVRGLRLPDGAQIDALNAHLSGDGGVLSMHASAGGITLPGPYPRLLQGSPLELAATLHPDAVGAPLGLTMTQRLFSLRLQAVTRGARSARFDLRLPDVAPLAALYHQDIRGALGLSGTVAQKGGTTHLEVIGTGALGGSSVVARLLGEHAGLRLVASVNRATAELEGLALSGRALTVTATARAERAVPGPLRALRARWRAALPNLALVSRSLAGSLDLRGTANGPLRSLTAQVQARSSLSVRGSPPGAIEARIEARGLPAAPSVAVRADGEFDGAPLKLAGSVDRTDRGFRVLVRHAAWKSVSIHGNLAAGPRLTAGQGSLRLRIGRLSDLRPLLGRQVAGSVAGNATLMPGSRGTRARFDLVARNVIAAGIPGNVHVFGAGPIDALPIELAARFPDLHGAPARLDAAGRLNVAARALDLDRIDAHYHGQTARLMAPARVEFAGGLVVRHLRLGMDHAVLAVDGEFSPMLDCRVTVQQVDAALLDLFAPHLLAQGELNADAHLEGSGSAPRGRASLEITGLRLANAAAQGLPALEARGSARLRGNVADVIAQLHAGSSSQLSLSGRAPLNATGPVALKLAGRMDVALINSVLEARGERAAGTLTVDATVTGAANAPDIGGKVELVNGDLRDYAEGIHIGDINARLLGGKGILRIASLTARAGPGELTAQGTIGVLEPHMPIDVSLSAHHIQPITSDILTANLDTRMRVAGTLRRSIEVSGTVRVNHASIMVPNGFPPNVATLEVIRPGEAARPRPAKRLVIGLGITLDAPDAIFVQGRGLDAQLGGRLRLAGTTADPLVSGGFSLVRGTFSLAGTNLNFNSGRVSFNGEGLRGRIDPTLDFRAQTSVMYTSPTTVTLRVSGYADAPTIALSSNPPLPQDDLLGLLLFGKPASELTGLQLAQTGAALAGLGGVGGGGGSRWNPLTWIRKGLGLNTLSVGGATRPGGSATGSQTGGASVTAGKYISNRVYVAATQTTYGTSQVRVEINLTRRLKLQTRLGNGTATAQGVTPENDPGSSIGLTYQIEY